MPLRLMYFPSGRTACTYYKIWGTGAFAPCLERFFYLLDNCCMIPTFIVATVS